MAQKKIDYIIVGCGLAGIDFSEQLRKHRKSFLVFDTDLEKSSKVAAGIFNPVILKRFTPVWKSSEQLRIAMPYYDNLERLLNVKIKHELKVLRKFNSVEEQNDWFTASDKPGLEHYLSTPLLKNELSHIKADLGFGEVLHTGRLDTKVLVNSYKNHLVSENQLIQEPFDYEEISVKEEGIAYKNFQAKHVVFAEGFGIKRNPFFSHLPLNGTKGEMLTIKAPDLKLKEILKSSVFLVPLGDDAYWVGATYAREDKTYQLSSEAREELIKKLDTLIDCDYQVINHEAGIRPTTKDRRPLVGTHAEHSNLHVLNGLGTRGVMISPYAAQQLYEHIELGVLLDAEMDIKRFG